ncbi:VOC family protein [Streptomyces roseoverticillatus]|uniref:VOC family protein n=1 Tax=Streptomyces roseoverticillatus TaxID=66429 RepID=UPI001F23EBCD|nr:VOC family protein [Streptomyces roseoverticillatus]MCF3101505.1 VOC family protein [Streptomyces roseoverticillatus]
MLHHLELWVPDLQRAEKSFGWLLRALGCTPHQHWEHGRSWRRGAFYLVVEQSPALTGGTHERCGPGMNHVAFRVESRAAVDALVEAAPGHGWQLMFPDRHPFAGGAGHYAAYLENEDGFEVELVAVTAGDVA